MSLTLIAVISSTVVLILSLIYWRIKKAYSYFEKRQISGPSPIFPIGTWNSSARIFVGKEDINNIEKYGVIFGTFDGLTPNLLIGDSDLVQKILSSEAAKFRSRRVKTAKNPSVKKVLQILHQEDQKDVLSLLKSAGTKINKLIPRLEGAANTLVRSLGKPQEDNSINVNGLVEEFILDVGSSAVLGLDLNEDPIFRQRFIKQYKNLLNNTESSSITAAIPYLYGGATNSIINGNSLDYFKSIISTELAVKSKEESIKMEAETLIDMILNVAKEEKKTLKKEIAQESEEEQTSDQLVLNDDVITHHILNSLLVLRHWTNCSILFSISALSQNPQIQAKLYSEISNVQDTLKTKPDTLEKLPYLNAFLQEVNRTYPAEFRTEKVTVEDVDITETLKIEKGCNVSIPIFALNKSKEVYPDPEIFDPERFLKVSQEKEQNSNIATKLSNLATKLAISKLVLKLKFSKKSDSETDLYKNGINWLPIPNSIQVGINSRV